MKNKYKNLMDYTSESILIINQEGFIIDANHTATKMFGYDENSFKKKHIKELLAMGKNFVSELCLDKDEKEACILEKTLVRKNGSTIEVEIATKKFENEAALFVYDVTERKKNIEYLKHLAWVQSHEVRPPLANILALVNLIDFKTENAEFNLTLLQCLKRSADKLDSVIRDIVHKSIMVYND